MAKLVTILPTLNAARELPATLERLAEMERCGLSAGLVVADGGSSDGSVVIARAAGARIAMGASGRGAQLALGAETAARMARAQDWYLFLHADTRLEPGWAQFVKAYIGRDEASSRAAYFRLALDDGSHRARRLERSVAWRCAQLALPYGDQGLLISRALYEALGGYKPYALFEDVDLVRRLGRRRLVGLPLRAVTSADKFRRDGYIRRSAKNLWLLARYFAGTHPNELARHYR